MPLGGQHISAALYQVFKDLGGFSGGDVGIPVEFKMVEAEVLRTNTPRDICRLAAGEHQLAQRDVQSMSVADIFTLMARTAREKLASQHKSAFLTDAEVYTVCMQCGLQGAMTAQEKRSVNRRRSVICVCLCVSVVHICAEDIAGAGIPTICLLGVSIM